METKTTVEIQADAEQQKIAPSTMTEIDAGARIAELEAEKAKLATERDNYRIGMLKAKGKTPVVLDEDEGEDDKIRRISSETLADSRLADIARELDSIIKKALIENKELKMALKNKPSTIAVSTGSESTQAVATSGILSKEDIDIAKARGWSDKKIELLKKNIQTNMNRGR